MPRPLRLLNEPIADDERAEIRRARAAERNRRKHPARRATLPVYTVTRGKRVVLQLVKPEPEPHWRPTTRAECADVPRPCPYVSCRWNLYLDVSARGSIMMNFPDIEPHEMAESCALDVADRGGATLEQIAGYVNLTRERVRQIVAQTRSAFKGLRRHVREK